MEEFNGAVAVVTGGTRGIGRAVSAALVEAGATVIAAYHRDESAADRAAATLADSPGVFDTRRVDVTDPERVETVVAAVTDAHDTPTMLVNNAAVMETAPLFRTADADWEAALDTNLTGAFNCLRAVGRRMLAADGGAVVNVSSVAALAGWPGQAAYAASKAGLEGLTRSAARELGGRGIRVNAVAPGYVDTDLLDDVDADRIPVSRAGAPEEVADTVAFLLGDRASYVNGAVLRVDGGLLA